MNKLSPTTHGILDYLIVVLLFISPRLVKMEPAGSALSSGLAIVHLVLTLLTDFRLGIVRVIPLRIHGLVELIVSVGLCGVAIAFRISGNPVSCYFYLGFSIILFIIWSFSEYRMRIKAF